MINNVLHHSSSIASQHISPAEGKTLHPATGGERPKLGIPTRTVWLSSVPQRCVPRRVRPVEPVLCDPRHLVQEYPGSCWVRPQWPAVERLIRNSVQRDGRKKSVRYKYGKGIRVWEHQNKLFQQQTRASWHLQHVFCISLVLKGHYSNTNSNICMCFGRR